MHICTWNRPDGIVLKSYCVHCSWLHQDGGPRKLTTMKQIPGTQLEIGTGSSQQSQLLRDDRVVCAWVRKMCLVPSRFPALSIQPLPGRMDPSPWSRVRNEVSSAPASFCLVVVDPSAKAPATGDSCVLQPGPLLRFNVCFLSPSRPPHFPHPSSPSTRNSLLELLSIYFQHHAEGQSKQKLPGSRKQE